MKRTLFLFIIFCSASLLVNAQNTNFGTNAGNAGLENTSIGFEAGDVTVSCCGTFVGHKAGKSVSTGSSNSFVGSFAGYYTTTGSENSFFGYASGYLNSSTGNGNSFVGTKSGYFNSASNNSFLGAYSGYNNTSGANNTFIGYQSGVKNTTAADNSFFGSKSGLNNVTGSRNSFTGTESGYSNTTGEENSFFGTYSGRYNTTGSYNCFFGYQSGEHITEGSDNTFIGFTAGSQTTTGSFNVSLGWAAGSFNLTGERNVFLGAGAGISNTGSRNVFIGYAAGSNETGSNKLIIDNGNSGSAPPLIYGDFNSRKVGIATNTLGSFTFSVNGDAFATGMWVSSDRRFKKEERTITGALEKIRGVSGVNYQFKKGDEARSRNFAEGEQLGFIAQDLKKVFPELVKEDGDGYLAVNYQGMIPVLVEALKELSSEVEHLRTLLSEGKTANSTTQDKIKGVALRQNYPNPSNHITTIEYELSDGITNAVLYIFDLNGKQVAVYPQLKGAGTGKVTLSASQLPAGLYHYSLVADGVIVDTKKMLLTK